MMHNDVIDTRGLSSVFGKNELTIGAKLIVRIIAVNFYNKHFSVLL